MSSSNLVINVTGPSTQLHKKKTTTSECVSVYHCVLMEALLEPQSSDPQEDGERMRMIYGFRWTAPYAHCKATHTHTHLRVHTNTDTDNKGFAHIGVRFKPNTTSLKPCGRLVWSSSPVFQKFFSTAGFLLFKLYLLFEWVMRISLII